MHSLAQHLQSQGRGNDTVLVHMTPREVGGLQALAQSAGGTLTRNPTTGLPEAGFLDSILPMIAGVAGGAIGMDPWMAAAGVGAITGIATGNLEKGLMSGLGAYGGAALGRTINPEGTIGGFGFGTPAAPPTPSLTTINAAPISPSDLTPNDMGRLGTLPGGTYTPPAGIQPITPTVTLHANDISTLSRLPAIPEEPAGFFDRFSANAARGLEGTGLEKFAPYAAGLGLATPFLGSSSSGLGALKPTEPRKLPPPRMYNRRPTYPVNRDPRDSSEFMYFDPSVPYFEPRPETVTSNQDYRSLARGLSSAFSPQMFADGGAVEARPRFAPDVAAPAGYAAQAPARSYVEQLYNFPRATNVPKLVKPTAETAALQAQYPTATKAQLSEYERAIAGGGDPSATRSLMQAYGPTSGIKELQPWSPDFKGFDYARSRPVDAFGNPIGWDAPTKTAPTMGANGVPSGWDPRDWENMKNTDLGSPSDEYILNNPWQDGKIGGPAFIGSLNLDRIKPSGESMFNRVTGNTGAGKHEGAGYQTALTNFNRPRIAENASIATDMEQIYSPEGLANLYPVDPEQMYSPGNVERLSAPLPAYLANPQPRTSGTGSTFLNFLNRTTAATAPSGQDYTGFGGTLRGLMNMTGGQYLNLFRTLGSGFLPGGALLNQGIGALQGALNVRSAPGFEGNNFLNYLTSGPSSEAAGANIAAGNLGGALRAVAPFNILGKPLPTDAKAAGGVNLEDGSFVVDARTVAELGNGSSGAGQELLARMGGKPIKGPGDGVSDSIRANIGGKQEARVARDEVKFDPETVKRVGGGNPKKGADRLYAMMRKAEKARKSASRGKDTGLRALVGEK